MVENKCYDPDCNEEECFNPEHYNYICFDPDCSDEKCMNEKHYNKQLLKDYQKNADLSVFDHREEIDYDEDVDISLCGCPDCADDDHDHHHDHNHEHHHHEHDHDHSHEHHHEHEHHEHDHKHEHEEEHHDESCGCGCDDDDCHDEEEHDHEHEHEHHEHEHNHGHEHEHEHHDHGHDHEHGHDHDHHHHDHDDDDFSLCACPDCADDDHDHDHGHGHDHSHGDGDLIAEGKPLLSNRPIQIMVSSGILFIAGHILEYLSFDMTIVTIIYMIAAIIAGYEIAVMAYNSLVKRHTIGPALLVVIACIASFIIGHGEEGAAVALLYYIAEFLEDYAELRAKRSIKSLVELAPETARVKVDGGEEVRNVDQVKIGEIVIIRPGDKVPLDGNIVHGTSSINQASITGESLPVTKTVGDEVFSGTVNEDGYLEMVNSC